MDVDKRPSSQYPPNAGATVQPVKPSEILGIKGIITEPMDAKCLPRINRDCSFCDLQ